jgi:hypothetical protein
MTGGKPAIEILFLRFDQAPKATGFPATGGQIIESTIVAAPKQRSTEDVGTHAGPSNIQKPNRVEDGKKQGDLAIAASGYENHIGIDKAHRLIRTWKVTDDEKHLRKTGLTSAKKPKGKPTPEPR